MRTSAPQMPAQAVAVTAGLLVALAGCGGGGASTTTGASRPATTVAPTTTAAAATTGSTQAAAVDPCSLLTDADVAKLAPGLGHGKLQTVAGTQICEWPNANGIPAVQLQVTTAPSTSLRKELANLNVGNSGYTIVAVAGVGDEAAAAFQKADASKGIAAGLATIAARSGGTEVSISTPFVQVLPGSPGFTAAKKLASTAISRLPGG